MIIKNKFKKAYYFITGVKHVKGMMDDRAEKYLRSIYSYVQNEHAMRQNSQNISDKHRQSEQIGKDMLETDSLYKAVSRMSLYS